MANETNLRKTPTRFCFALATIVSEMLKFLNFYRQKVSRSTIIAMKANLTFNKKIKKLEILTFYNFDLQRKIKITVYNCRSDTIR